LNLIITRHPAAVGWLKKRGITGNEIKHATGDEGQSGDSVYGVLPVDYVEKFLGRGLQVYFIALPGLTLNERKGDLPEAAMEAAGACLLRVVSIRIERTGIT
jgi:CRISPR-associated protein Csx16